MDRWATFDCYGTLIDWNGGIGRELERLFGAEHVARLLHGYHELEREIEHERPAATYRDVLTTALCRLAEREDMPLAAAERGRARAVAAVLAAVSGGAAALEDARARGWKLAILSNTDRDYIDASLELIGVPFDARDRRVGDRLVQAGAPPLGGVRRAGRRPRVHVHVGASLFHDIAPATELGLPTVWINRLGEAPEPQPDVELHSLTGLGAALDSLAA